MFDILKRRQKILIIILLAGFAYLLFSANLKNRTNLRWYDRTALWVVSPLQNFVTFVIDRSVSAWRHYIYLVGLVDENGALRQKLAQLEFRNEELIEAALENQRLRKLLLFQERIQAPRLPAEVIALDLSSQFQMLRVNRGKQDGVLLGMPVVGDGGVVGQIFRVTEKYADVLLETDRNSRIDALIQRSRARGIVVGAGRKTFNMQLKYLSRAEDVRAGDLAITSGLDGVFPEGLSIGYITALDRPEVGIFQMAEIQPTVEFSKIKEVIIILQENRPDLPEIDDK